MSNLPPAMSPLEFRAKLRLFVASDHPSVQWDTTLMMLRYSELPDPRRQELSAELRRDTTNESEASE